MSETIDTVTLVKRASAILFDMDGVIVLTEHLKFRAYKKVFRDTFGVELPESETQWVGKDEQQVMQFWLEKLSLTARPHVKRLIKKKREVYRALLRNVDQIEPVPGVVRFVSWLREQGKQIALVTGSSRSDQRTIFRSLSLDAFFSAVVTREDVNRPKPDPDSYSLAMKRLQSVPGDCLAFDDSPSGVASAKAAGVEVVCVLTTHDRSAFPFCRHFVDDFSTSFAELLNDD